jgi:hypothetical protein
MIEVYLGNELGNLCEQDCKAIKSKMDGKSYYGFNVSWSNCAGNCQLIVKTDHPKATKDDVRKMFLGVLAGEFGNLADKHFILEQYSLNHYRYPNAVTLFEGCSDCTLYFSDVIRAREILDYSDVRYYLNNNNDGWPFCGFDKRYLSDVLNKFADKGVDVLCFKRLGV